MMIARDWVLLCAAIFALCSGAYGAFQAYALIPLTQARHDREIETLKSDMKADHETLIRIEGRVEWIKQVLDKNRMAEKSALTIHP